MNLQSIFEATSKHPLVRNLPVAKFYYQGSHSHPVRRTVLVVENNRNFIRGYEIREGKNVRSASKDCIKSYKKSEIAKYGDYCRLRMSAKNKRKKQNQSTLERLPLTTLIENKI